jgi:predicted murein hydrolase (TIGR00659 family)
MHGLSAPWSSAPQGAWAIFWSAATVGGYLLARRIHRRWPRWWLSPLAVAPALLILAALSLHTSYPQYLHGTGWLMTLLGPATVAFAVPIHERRELIRQYWPVLGLGVAVGSLVAMLSSWLLAGLLGLDGSLRLSLLPRSLSTPFAMAVSRDLGGSPELTAVFVVVTGVFGAALGELLLARLALRSGLARGALLGMGAHGVGTARAHQYGREEGAIAGLVMVFSGVLNVLLAPLLAVALRQW